MSQVAAMHKEVSAQNSNILSVLKMSRCSSESVQDDFSTCLLDKHSTHQMDDEYMLTTENPINVALDAFFMLY